MITYDGIIFSSGNPHGGVSVYFRELLRHAALGGEEFEVVVHDPTISAQQLNCRPENLLFRAPRIFERIRSVKNVPLGIFHSSYYRSTSSSRIKNIVTVYDFTYEKHTNGPKAVFHKLQKRAAIMRADAAICISENTRRDLIELLPRYPSERIFVTHLAASEQFLPLETGSVTSLSKEPFVLFVGSRPGYKNFKAAVQSVGLTKSLALVCAGGGSFTGDERALLEDVLPGRHFHAGPVSAEGLNELYNAAVCLLYPSLYEGFGIPPLEAMQSRMPFCGA